MKMITRLVLFFVLSFTLVKLPMMKSAHAGMISTPSALDSMARTQHQENVATFLNRDDVKNQLVKLGVSQEEATRRIAGLSDSELKKMSGEIDHSTAGGSVTGVLIVIILVLLIVYLFKRV